MPMIGTGRVQAQTGLVSFTQTAAPATALSSFTLQTPRGGALFPLFQNFSNSGGNVVLELCSIAAGTGITLSNSNGVLYISMDTSSTANYASLDSQGVIPWSNLPTEVQTVPVAYVIPDRPPPGQIYNVVLPIVCVIPANLSGSVVYIGVPATSSALFTLRQISKSTGATTTIGTVLIMPNSNSNCTFSTQDFVTLQIGDVLQLVAPITQDATIGDIGITILATKV